MFKRFIAILTVSFLAATTLWAGAVPLRAQEVPPSQAVLRNAYLLTKLQEYLSRSNQSFSSLQLKIEEARSEIDTNRETIVTLEAQLQQLEILTEETSHKIKNVEEQIQVREQDIATLMEAIEFNEVERLNQGNLLNDYLRLLYFEKNLYFNQSNQANGLKILLQATTLSKVFQGGTYLRLLEQQTESVLSTLISLDNVIKTANEDLQEKRAQLSLLSAQLDGERRNLEAEREGKENLLAQTRGSDEIYRELFASYKLAQEVILEDINLFHTNIDALDQRFALFAPQLTPEELEQISAIKSDATRNFGVDDASRYLDLGWPVKPALGLSAFFEDLGYVATFGVQHHALDIPASHNTVFVAPADGVVYKVYDAAALEDPKDRLGYGYLMVAHRKGVMTLYGHISASLVKEGDFVKKGQVLGLTGATPGTPGAGARTTGPHLHFEVFQDGIRVDPLNYLPLELIPEKKWTNIPERYLQLMASRIQEALEGEGFDETALDDLEATGQLSEISELTQDL